MPLPNKNSQPGIQQSSSSGGLSGLSQTTTVVENVVQISEDMSGVPIAEQQRAAAANGATVSFTETATVNPTIVEITEIQGNRPLSLQLEEAERGSTAFSDPDPTFIDNAQDFSDESDHIDAAMIALLGYNPSESTFISRPTYSYDVPEAGNVDTKFIYNYFRPDERTNGTGRELVDLTQINDPDLAFQLQQGDRVLNNVPRYVKISFSPANDPYANTLPDNSDVITGNIDKIIIEGGSSSPFFTGLELIDTGLESSVYSLLSGSMANLNISTPEDSPVRSAEKLADALSLDGGLTGEDKKLLVEFMSNLQNEGLKFAPTDVSPEIAAFSSDQITQQSFSLKFNNLFFGDIIKSSSRILDTVFQDEIRSLTSFSTSVQQALTSQVSSEEISEINYQTSVQAIEQFDIADTSSVNTEITHVGYVVYKYEVLNNGSTKLIDRLVVSNQSSNILYDTKIKYGASYIYKIRSVFQISNPTLFYDEANNANDDLFLVKFLVASEGITKSVACVEMTPPLPPANLNIRLDYKNRIPMLSWQFPINPQRDIKRFQIFKRNSINEPFSLLAEYDFDNSTVRSSVGEVAQSSKLYRMSYPKLTYLDVDYVAGSSPIYSIAAVDAHGLSSNYGTQIQIHYDKFRNRINKTIISGPGAPKPYPNLYLRQDAFVDCVKCSGYSRMHLFFNPEYYQVTQYQVPAWDVYYDSQYQILLPGSEGPENDLNLLSVNPDFETYQIHLVNVDLQKDELIKIKLADKSGSPLTQDPASFSSSNLSFEQGISGIN